MQHSIEERHLVLQEKQLELEKLKLDFETEKLNSKSKKNGKLNAINATIIVAFIGFFATTTVTIVNNYNVNQLETRKFEFDLIKKGLEQPTAEERVKFLKFISRLKLVRDYNMTNAIDSAIESPSTLPNLSSVPPTSLSQGRVITPDGATTVLTVNGGELGTNAVWRFYSDSCNGQLIGSGHVRTITVNPSKTTTYFARAESPSGNTDCISITVDPITLEDIMPPQKPQALKVLNQSSPGNPFITLTVIGGDLGKNASWYLTTDSCNGRPAGSGRGRVFRVSPKVKTSYFIKAIGATGITDCVNITVNPIKSK